MDAIDPLLQTFLVRAGLADAGVPQAWTSLTGGVSSDIWRVETPGRQPVCVKRAVAQLRYERGLSNNLDVVSAETSLLNAESRRILALAESAISRLSLRATLGNLDPQRDLADQTP